MLFNSYVFIFVFLPVTLIAFFGSARFHRGLAKWWLVVASFAFYGYWEPAHIPLLLASGLFNFAVGRTIAARRRAWSARRLRLILAAAIAADLALLGVFKYAGFAIGVLNDLGVSDIQVPQVALPLGISFFTFTQIAFLVDAARGYAAEYSLRNFLLFVSYFPHLLAGPILHHRQMMPQFDYPKFGGLRASMMSAGLALFTVGLAKKVLLADTFAPVANGFFDGAHDLQPTMTEAWVGTLAYALQIYFDFSGYSDMAIGLALMIGIRFPLNFNSPYKATSIIDFWRRWHMTLSQFLRDYLYIPLGGNKLGSHRRYVNLLLTMLLGGLWHGANWTFVVWGALHGIYLLIAHAWRAHLPPVGAWTGRFATFAAVCIAWVFFRADSAATAVSTVSTMIGLKGLSLPARFESGAGSLKALGFIRFEGLFPHGFFEPQSACAAILVGIAICWFMPNSQELMTLRWLPPRLARGFSGALARGAVCGVLMALCLSFLGRESPFLYFQF